MNRLILKYAYPLTVVILLVFAWVVYQRISRGWSEIIPLAVAAVIVWALGVPTFIYLWPRITVDGFRRAISSAGSAVARSRSTRCTPNPARSSASASTGSLMGTGTDDVLYVVGWLDLKDRPQVLQVPDMAGRYYCLQFTDPATSANFAYVGKPSLDRDEPRPLPARRAGMARRRPGRDDQDRHAASRRTR